MEFHLERSFTRLSKWAGYAALLTAAFFLAGPIVDPDTTWWLTVPSGGLALAGAIFCLRLAYQPRHYSIQLSDDGIRIPSDGRWAPWSQLGGLSERPLLHRVDILDRSGERFASLEYQLAGFSAALERTVAGLQLQFPNQVLFRRVIASWAALFGVVLPAAMAVFGACFWTSSGNLTGLLLAFLMVGVVGYDALSEIWSVELTRQGVKLRRGLRTEIAPWHDIADVELSLRDVGRGSQRLEVFLIRNSGRRERIRPIGCNPFLLKSRMAQELALARAAV
jgi:hypothetical protein